MGLHGVTEYWRLHTMCTYAIDITKQNTMLNNKNMKLKTLYKYDTSSKGSTSENLNFYRGDTTEINFLLNGTYYMQ